MTHKFYKTKPEIIKWLNSMGISNYTLMPDKKYGFMVNASNGVDLRKKELTTIPVKFNIVDKFFDCSRNNLTSLQGFPLEVDGDVYCNENKISSLQYAPTKISGSFSVHFNLLTSLVGCPRHLLALNCSHNKLTSLKGSPDHVAAYFNADYNLLTSLEGISPYIDGHLDLKGNNINTLKFIPKKVEDYVCLWDNAEEKYETFKKIRYYEDLHKFHIIELVETEKKFLDLNIKRKAPLLIGNACKGVKGNIQTTQINKI